MCDYSLTCLKNRLAVEGEEHLSEIPQEVQQSCSVGAAEHVRFVQRSANAYEHRDAIRFENGKVLPLQFLAEGQRAVVLSLGEPESEAELAGVLRA